MKKIIIISGHGRFATGLQSTLELLVGFNEDVYFVDFTADDTDETLREKYISIINTNKDTEVLFICDILGGTPFKVSAEISNNKDNMEVVVGCNVSSMIEVILQKESMTLDYLAKEIVKLSKETTVCFQKVVLEQIKINDFEVEDGI